MSIIQQFYDLAKIEADAIALKVSLDQNTHQLAWSYYKSKVKHLALGLLDKGASPETPLFLSKNPDSIEWIYSLLAGMSLKMPIVISNQDSMSSQLSLNKNKVLFIFSKTDFSNIVDSKNLELVQIFGNFRDIFNLGIIREKELLSKLNKSRNHIVREDSAFQILNSTYSYEQILDQCQAITAQLTAQFSLGKKEIFSYSLQEFNEVSLIPKIFFPIYVGISSWLTRTSDNLNNKKITLLYLGIQEQKSIENQLDKNTKLQEVLKKYSESKSKFSRFIYRRKIRTQTKRILPRKLKALFIENESSEILKQFLQSQSIAEILINLP